MNKLADYLSLVLDEMDSAFSYNRIITDDDGEAVDYEIVSCNDMFARWSGISRENIEGRRIKEIVPDITVCDFNWISFYGTVALTGETNTVERFQPETGRFFQVKAVCPKRGYFLSYINDITEFKRAEIRLHEIRHQYETIFSQTADPHAVLVNGVFDDCNEASLRMMHTDDRDYIIGRHPWDVSPEYQPDGELSADKAMWHITRVKREGNINFEWYHKNADGEVFPAAIYLTAVKLGTREMIYVTWRDISRHKEVEQKQRETEDCFRKFTELNPVAIMIYQDDRWVYANPAAEKISGYSLEELTGMSFWAFIHPDYVDLVKQRGHERQRGRDPQKRYEFKIVRKNGVERWIDLRAERITLKGEAAAIISAVDITEKKAIEAELIRNREDLTITLNSIGDAVIATDANGAVSRMNPIAEELTGWSAEEARGRDLMTVFRIINSETRKKVENPAEKVIRTGRIVGLANHTMLISRDGKERQIADSGAPIQDADGVVRGAVLVFRDVTEQYRMERQFREARKMDAVGQLAGGVAHDFNNMLSAIMGAAELLSSRCDHDSSAMHHLKLILDASSRAGDLTRKLLDFSRRGKQTEQPIDMHEIIEDTVTLLRRTVDPSISIETDLQAERHIVNGDPSQLQNAVLNLGVNARDAMPDGGKIIISTATVIVNERSRIGTRHGIRGEMIRICMSDSGVGISREIRERIFEPFFTTKGIGRGTGLGLSSVYGAVKEHAGAVIVSSEPGSGTKFTLFLPVTDENISDGAENRDNNRQKNGRSILVIDDENIVRITIVEMLREDGHTVTGVESGEKGLAVIERNPDIDLVILDIAMPGMNGYETFRRIRQIRSDIPVVLSSGYSRQQGISRIDDSTGVKFIQKPVSRALLYRTVDGLFADD